MIHIHGTPIGGPRQDVARFLQGRHALAPFLRPDDLPVLLDVCKSVWLDSSTYSAWTRGFTIDFEAYTQWVRSLYRHPAVVAALIPDVIDGDEVLNDELLARWPRDLRHVGVPVWHMHERIERLEFLTAIYPIVALGSSGEFRSPGSKIWWKRMREALSAICDEYGRPPCKLHGLRMLDPRIFSQIPLASADSTNAGRNNNQLDRFGIYKPPTAAQRAAVIADRIEAYQSAPVFVRSAEELLA